MNSDFGTLLQLTLYFKNGEERTGFICVVGHDEIMINIYNYAYKYFFEYHFIPLKAKIVCNNKYLFYGFDLNLLKEGREEAIHHYTISNEN